MARTRASQAASAAFGKVGTVTVPRDADGNGPAVDTPEAPPVPQGPVQRRAAGKRATTPPPDAVPTMDALEQRRWRRDVGNTGLALRAAQADVAAREADWVRLIAKARAEGAPERLLIAAAADADLDLPDRL
jgi:hypothetical protein